jgi:hypothetical protein
MKNGGLKCEAWPWRRQWRQSAHQQLGRKSINQRNDKTYREISYMKIWQ